jgi:hypothetical protein
MKEKDFEDVKNVLQQMRCVLEDLAYMAESDWVRMNLLSAIGKIAKDISKLKSE